MNILITGGTGLVGKVVLEQLDDSFSNITAIFRNRITKGKSITWVKLDIAQSSMSLISSLVKNKDVIIHNAACLEIGKTDKEILNLRRINVDFTENLLKSIEGQGVKKFIFTSTLSSLKKPLPTVITEDSEIDPISYYSKSKIIGEELVEHYSTRYGIAHQILRLSSPISLSLDVLPDTVVKKWINQSINNQAIQVFGRGSRSQDFVAVSDIASAFLACINKEVQNGIYNIASGTSLSMLELAKLITNKFGNKYEMIGSDENECDRWNVSIDKARAELGYDPKFTSRSIITKLLDEVTV